jgi:hypothetical protein
MRREITHHEAAKVLAHGGGIIYTQSGIAYTMDRESEGHVLLTQPSEGLEWVLAASDVVEVFSRNAHLYVNSPELPKLPRGYVWGGNNPLSPDRVEEVLPENFGTREESFSRFVKSTYCNVASNQTQRDIARAVADLWDQQHETKPAP